MAAFILENPYPVAKIKRISKKIIPSLSIFCHGSF